MLMYSLGRLRSFFRIDSLARSPFLFFASLFSIVFLFVFCLLVASASMCHYDGFYSSKRGLSKRCANIPHLQRGRKKRYMPEKCRICFQSHYPYGGPLRIKTFRLTCKECSVERVELVTIRVRPLFLYFVVPVVFNLFCYPGLR